MDNKNHCKDLLSSMSEYIDGSLNDELCNELEKHLSDCNNCRVVVNTLRKTIEIYHDQGSQEKLSSDMKNRLYIKLNLNDYKQK
jgi:anti-sigma factor RsiW